MYSENFLTIVKAYRDKILSLKNISPQKISLELEGLFTTLSTLEKESLKKFLKNSNLEKELLFMNNYLKNLLPPMTNSYIDMKTGELVLDHIINQERFNLLSLNEVLKDFTKDFNSWEYFLLLAIISQPDNFMTVQIFYSLVKQSN